MTLTRMIFTKRFVRMAISMLTITLAVLSVCADCSDNNRSGSGMWQGGSDSEPGWR